MARRATRRTSDDQSLEPSASEPLPRAKRPYRRPPRDLLYEIPKDWAKPGPRGEHLSHAKDTLIEHLGELISERGHKWEWGPSRLKGKAGRAALRVLLLRDVEDVIDGCFDDFQIGEISADNLVQVLRELTDKIAEDTVRSEIRRKDPRYRAIVSGILSSNIGDKITGRLLERGLPLAEAQQLGREIAADFSHSFEGSDKRSLSAAVDLAVSAIGVTKRLASQFAKASSPSNPEPQRWTDRDPVRHPTAEVFLKDVYRGRLGMDGDLTLADLGRIDTPLVTALNRQFKGRREALHILIPTVEARNDARLKRHYGYIPQGADRQSKLSSLSRISNQSP